jgi:hypothetical protein
MLKAADISTAWNRPGIPTQVIDREVLIPKKKGLTMLPENQKEAYEAFYASTVDNGIVDEKTTVMIQLAASFVIGCYP